jgi:hypothetical protein
MIARRRDFVHRHLVLRQPRYGAVVIGEVKVFFRADVRKATDHLRAEPKQIYVSELYPTHLRATAVGWFFGIGRIGSFLAPAVVGFMLHFGFGAYVLDTFALTFFIASVALWMVGVETKGRVLEQINAAATPA